MIEKHWGGMVRYFSEAEWEGHSGVPHQLCWDGRRLAWRPVEVDGPFDSVDVPFYDAWKDVADATLTPRITPRGAK